MTTDTPRKLLLDQVDSLRAWKRWSVERLRVEAADVLGREEPVDVEDLPDDDVKRLVGAWERIEVGVPRKAGQGKR